MFLRPRLFQILVCVLVLAALWAIGQLTRKAPPPDRAGWDDLVMCYEASSLTGRERLTFSWRGSAELRRLDERGSYVDDGPLEGTWSFDETTRRYQVDLGGHVTSYLLVSPPDSHTCMLIAGELTAADLTASWFAVDDQGDVWDREPIPR